MQPYIDDATDSIRRVINQKLRTTNPGLTIRLGLVVYLGDNRRSRCAYSFTATQIGFVRGETPTVSEIGSRVPNDGAEGASET